MTTPTRNPDEYTWSEATRAAHDAYWDNERNADVIQWHAVVEAVITSAARTTIDDNADYTFGENTTLTPLIDLVGETAYMYHRTLDTIACEAIVRAILAAQAAGQASA